MGAAEQVTWGTGRRKTAVARVRIKRGKGAIVINRRELNDYFPTVREQEAVLAPLRATNSAGQWDVISRVTGGGPTGQAGAVSLGIARALKLVDPNTEDRLRAEGLLTRDSRMKERKKYGRKAARRSFQFSKR
ncbi:MAG: 30S ribosomal protein S9 [Planctomycetes bacterium]|nr:30S ribosomal protein S9 [Planctomycetota bacterium]MBI3844594.1 30S ribosomal protein S9 [Planctomycetota bacterium]